MVFNIKNFWETFAKDNWEKEPFASDQVFASSPIKEDILFQNVLDSLKKDSIFKLLWIDTVKEKFYYDNPFYPKLSDKSFLGYHTRMEKELNGKSYCLIINHLEAENFNIWDFGRRFLKGLYEIIGFNNIGTVTNLFVGNGNTPFGVHLDFEKDSVFHIPIIGKKAIRLWNKKHGEIFPEINNNVNYDKFIDSSRLIKAAPGGLVYWPSDLLHISEKVDDFSVSIAIALTCYKNLPLLFLDIMKDYFSSVNEYKDCATIAPKENPKENLFQIPKEIIKARNIFQELLSDDILKTQWAKVITGANFAYPTIPAQIDSNLISIDSIILGESEFPIICLPLNKNVSLFANGHSNVINCNSDVLLLIEKINDGLPLKVRLLIEDFSLINSLIIFEILNWLLSVRAIKTSV